MFADQLTHLLKQSAHTGDVKPFLYGHIASHDPLQHRVRCIIPSMMDQDGNPTLSPWMPMGTMSVGPGSGVQVMYQGGATAANPTGGEQVLIAMFDRHRGVAAVPCMFYNAAHKPPATKLPSIANGYTVAADAAAPGDVIIAAAAAQPGGANSFIRVRQSGPIQIWCAGPLMADVIGDITLTTETGNATITVAKGDANIIVATGNAMLKAAGTVNIVGALIRLSAVVSDKLLQLCTTAFATLYNTHTHPDAQGGTTGIPNQQAGPSTLTTIVQAE